MGYLMAISEDGKTLHRGSPNRVAKRLGVTRWTVHNLWDRALKTGATDLNNFGAIRSYKGRSGSKRVYDVNYLGLLGFYIESREAVGVGGKSKSSIKYYFLKHLHASHPLRRVGTFST